MSDAPAAIEFTRFDQPEHRRIINVINAQDIQPPIPACELKIKVKLDGRKAARVYLPPKETVLEYLIEGDYLTVTLPKVELYEMRVIEYEECL